MSKIDFNLVGIPEFFASTVVIEDAGDGLIRAIYCTHHGVLMPVCSIVRPAMNVLKIAPGAMEFCRNVLGASGMRGH